MATDRDAEKDYSKIYKRKEITEDYMGKKKQNKYHHTQVDLTASPIHEKEIIKEIAKLHNFSQADVNVILEAYKDIIKREIIFKGRFKIPGVVDIYSELWNIRHDKVERVKEIEDEEVYICPPITVRPKIRLDENLKNNYKNARRYEEALAFKIEPQDWYKPFIIEEPDWVQRRKDAYEKYLRKKNNQKE